jgi:hypothetical protein
VVGWSEAKNLLKNIKKYLTDILNFIFSQSLANKEAIQKLGRL